MGWPPLLEPHRATSSMPLKGQNLTPKGSTAATLSHLAVGCYR